MGSRLAGSAKKLAGVVLSIALLGTILFAKASDPNGQKPDANASTRLRIEVTAGEKSDPLALASVYVRYVVKHSMGKEENIEMNIKTSKDGIAIANGIPRGNVLIQVIADGWKTFGKWYEATDGEQTIKIHLDKPPKWF
ncbi:MAG TPA: hypothetical protein VGZ48_11770 [Candidatus Acidoferrales bacterium]|jgi:hypothetical protein|nr:hypothetical protein [Candidatus Acidoferrales bacterium]